MIAEWKSKSSFERSQLFNPLSAINNQQFIKVSHRPGLRHYGRFCQL
jgi:hypothetical protein